MEIPKIGIALLIIICAIGMVAAGDAPHMKTGNGYEKSGPGIYSNENSSIDLIVFTEIGNDDLEKHFKNNSNIEYTVFQAMDDTFNYTDCIDERIGVKELAEIDMRLCLVEFSSDTDANTTFDKFYDELSEFNELNNITPISPSAIDF